MFLRCWYQVVCDLVFDNANCRYTTNLFVIIHLINRHIVSGAINVKGNCFFACFSVQGCCVCVITLTHKTTCKFVCITTNVTKLAIKGIKNGRLRGVLMKNVVWKLFEQTGNVAYYLLYKELTKNGRNNKSHRPKNN